MKIQMLAGVVITTSFLFAQSTHRKLPPHLQIVGQSMVECTYEYRVNAPLRAGTSNETEMVRYRTVLQAGGSVSKFWDWHSFKKDSITFFSETEIAPDSLRRLNGKYYYRVADLFSPTVFRNHPAGKFTVLDDVLFDFYEYGEPLPIYEWKIYDDTLTTVCGYECQKASALLGGRQWVVWFAPELMINAGPWKFSGLPGLILKATDESGTHDFEAIGIRNSTLPIYIAQNAMRIKTSKNILEKKKLEYDALDSRDIFDTSEMDLGGRNTIILDGIRVDIVRKTRYSALEIF